MMKLFSLFAMFCLGFCVTVEAGGYVVTHAPMPVAQSYYGSAYYAPAYVPAAYVPVVPAYYAPVYVAPVQLAPVYATPVVVAAPVVVRAGYVPHRVAVRQYSGHRLLPSYSYSQRVGPFGGVRVREVVR